MESDEEQDTPPLSTNELENVMNFLADLELPDSPIQEQKQYIVEEVNTNVTKIPPLTTKPMKTGKAKFALKNKVFSVGDEFWLLKAERDQLSKEIEELNKELMKLQQNTEKCRLESIAAEKKKTIVDNEYKNASYLVSVLEERRKKIAQGGSLYTVIHELESEIMNVQNKTALILGQLDSNCKAKIFLDTRVNDLEVELKELKQREQDYETQVKVDEDMKEFLATQWTEAQQKLESLQKEFEQAQKERDDAIEKARVAADFKDFLISKLKSAVHSSTESSSLENSHVSMLFGDGDVSSGIPKNLLHPSNAPDLTKRSWTNVFTGRGKQSQDVSSHQHTSDMDYIEETQVDLTVKLGGRYE